MESYFLCSNCGSRLHLNDSFCNYCGKRLDWSSGTPVAVNTENDILYGPEFGEAQPFYVPRNVVERSEKLNRKSTGQRFSFDKFNVTFRNFISDRRKIAISLLALAGILLLTLVVAVITYEAPTSGIPTGGGNEPIVTPEPVENPDAPKGPLPDIKYFKASTPVIPAGQATELSWEVIGADEVNIDNGIGTVSNSGRKSISPSETTRYTITATNKAGKSTKSVIVTVNQGMPVVVSFTASPSTVTSGQSVTLKWVVNGATTVRLEGTGTVPATGSQVVTPVATTTYTLTATNKAGITTATVTVTMTKGSIPVITGFTATPEAIEEGETVKLEWYVTGADTVTIDKGIGTVPLLGFKEVSPVEDTTYILTATNSAGSTTASVTVTVTSSGLPVISSFGAVPVNILSGGSSTLQWTVTRATSVSINQGIGSVALSGSRTVSPAVTTTYTLTATNENGSVSRSVTVNVGTISPPVINSFTANPSTIQYGGTAILSWDVTNANTVAIDQGVVITGLMTRQVEVSPAQTTTYTLTATNEAGSVTRTVTVTVTN